MNDIPANIIHLFLTSQTTTLSSEEEQELNTWIAAHPESHDALDKLKNYVQASQLIKQYQRINIQKAWNVVNRKTKAHPGWYRRRMIARIGRVAAVMVLPLTFGLIWLYQEKDKQENALQYGQQVEKTYTVLKSTEGHEIVLNDPACRDIYSVDGNVIAKDSAKTLIMNDDIQKDNLEHIINVPTGGEYKIILADGTKVWINSDSELKFPSKFDSDTRQVALSGEAYFEVKPDSTRPFIVVTDKSVTKVLGTSFNVSSYAEDSITHTTLVNGKVEVEFLNRKYVLQPSEQLEMNHSQQHVNLQKVNTDLFTSWKDGIFRFQDMPLEQLAVKLQRWYDVPFVFKHESCKKFRFTGAVERDIDFKEFMKLIEKTTNINFNIEDNRVIISRK